MSGIIYRPEIDGLRAFAVLPVILFHLSPESLPNGFLGVDVFFVISGYLISGILLRSVSKADFSMLNFWVRRVRRLFPALATTLTISLLAGWFVLFGPEWKSLAWQSLATLTSSANILYWRTAGDYWGQTADSMPLLHMWSLSVEEQFYVIYPLVLCYAARRLPPRTVSWLLVTGALCSFILMAIGLAKFRAAAFYLLPCRMWEMLVGGYLASLQPPQPSKRHLEVSVGGVLLLVAAYLVPIGDSEFSLLGCASAVFATGLVLRHANSGSMATRILSAKPLVQIGRMSYSLYLWHWPVIVLGPFFLKMSVAETACVITGLSWLSWKFVEQQTRHLASRRFATVLTFQSGILLASILLPFVAQRSTFRFTPPAYNAAANIQPPYTARVERWTGTWETGLTLGNLNTRERRSIILLGDSHGVMYFMPIKDAAEAAGMTLTSFAADGGTSPFFVQANVNMKHYGYSWNPDDRRRFDLIRRDFINSHQPQVAVLTGRWSSYFAVHGADVLAAHFRNLIQAFPADTRFIVIGQPPELPFGSGGFQDGELSIPPLRAFFEDPEAKARRLAAHQIIRRLAADDARLRFIDVDSIFETTAGIRFMEDGSMLYKDDDHLSMAGADLCKSVISRAVLEVSLVDKTGM